MSCNTSMNFYAVASPDLDLQVGRYYEAPMGFEVDPFDDVIGDEPGVGENVIGGDADQ